MAGSAQSPWTIEELAARAGMTVRNIRAHQSRGLIPQPERRGRIAYYGPSHERALARVHELQQRGYNLAAIVEMVRADRESDIDLPRTVLAPLLEGEEVVLTQQQMAGMFGLAPDRRRLEVALDAGLVRDLGGGRYAAPSRRLLDAVVSLVNQGMAILDVYEMQIEIARSTRDVAHRFVDSCLRCAWQPTEQTMTTDSEYDVRARFDDLRRQFTIVLAATFAVNVRRATETVIALSEALAKGDA